MADETWTTISIKRETFEELREKRHSIQYTESWDAFVTELLQQFDPEKTHQSASENG